MPAPLNVRVAPAVSKVGLSVPEIVHVWTVALKLTAVFEVPFMVTFWIAGLNVKPVFAGVIV